MKKTLSFKEKEYDLATMPYTHAVLIGIFQSIAVIPGVSRSAATIIGGLWLGMSRESIVRFSFLLAIPTMIAASVDGGTLCRWCFRRFSLTFF
jgi:undecaprenyl-diphosphatase